MYRLRLENKVAVVTGVASGMGQAIAKMFAEEGAKVVGCDFNTIGGEKTIAEINTAGGDALFVPCNLRKKRRYHKGPGGDACAVRPGDDSRQCGGYCRP